MEFTNETVYDWRALLALNRAVIRGSGRRWRSLLLRLLGGAWALTLLVNGWAGRGKALGIAELVLGVVVLLWVVLLNYLRAWLAGRLVLKGNTQYTAHFDEEGYTLSTGGKDTRCQYGAVAAIYEDRDYVFFMLSRNQGHIFRKKGFEDFIAFLVFAQDKTGKKAVKLF